MLKQDNVPFSGVIENADGTFWDLATRALVPNGKCKRRYTTFYGVFVDKDGIEHNLMDIFPNPNAQTIAGTNGASAFEVAVANGFVGTVEDWLSSLVGHQGPEGPQGLQGIEGAEGPQGAQGPRGIEGPQGLKGDDGNPGPQGVAGPTGPKGDTGPVGPSGEDGATGPQGIQGPKGDTGLSGVKGATGDQGIQGVQGPKGDTGAQGAAGPQGPTGLTGATGPQGVKGDTGPQGPQGVPGPTGATGATGASGLKGDTGATGAAGATGPAGPTGATGPAGPSFPNDWCVAYDLYSRAIAGGSSSNPTDMGFYKVGSNVPSTSNITLEGNVTQGTGSGKLRVKNAGTYIVNTRVQILTNSQDNGFLIRINSDTNAATYLNCFTIPNGAMQGQLQTIMQIPANATINVALYSAAGITTSQNPGGTQNGAASASLAMSIFRIA